MILLDTNVYIYMANSMLPAAIITGREVAFASVTRIEALGFWDLNAGEASLLAEFFRGAKQFDLTEQVIIRAIFLRQTRKMRLGDAIIGATAVENDLELWTANTKDFAGIEGLRLHNPVENM